MELENYQATFQPRERCSSFRARNFNLDYAKHEFIWYLKGDRYDDSIQDYASIWKKLKSDIDGGYNSNYGQYIFSTRGANVKTNSQFDYVVSTLVADPDSRRAAMVLLNTSHLYSENPDIVCTYGLSFRIREGKLNMSVSMRSNDAIFGLTNDVFCFSMIHEMVLVAYNYYANETVELGEYTHKADSLHVYERHYDMLEELVKEGHEGWYPVDIPKMSYASFGMLFGAVHDGTEKADEVARQLNKKADVRFYNWLFH